MIDLTSQFAAAALNKADWSPDRALVLAQSISAQVGGVTDWDQDAGEEWIRILEGASTRALVSIAVPFGILLETAIGGLDLSVSGINLVAVSDMDARVLTCTRDALVAVFGERAVDSPALDVRAFSAEELWFVTVS